ERQLGDVDTKEVVNIPRKRIQEPRFHHSSQGGKPEDGPPSKKEFVAGDQLPKPEGGGGGGRSREGSPDGEGEDDFRFTLSRDEYLDILFEELELPDLVKTYLKETVAFQTTRAGFTASGSPRNINMVRTMRHSLARRISLHRPTTDELEVVAKAIAELEGRAERTEAEE